MCGPTHRNAASFGIHARIASLGHLPAGLGDFNCVVLSHVLEHFARYGMSARVIGRKDIASSQDSFTPAVFGIFHRTGLPCSDIQPDTELRHVLELYVAGSKALLSRIDAMLQREQVNKAPVIVWGVGELTKKLLCETVLQDCCIAAFVDRNPANQGQMLAHCCTHNRSKTTFVIGMGSKIM